MNNIFHDHGRFRSFIMRTSFFCAGKRQTIRRSCHIFLILALLSQSFLVVGLSSAAAQKRKPRRNRKASEAAARKRAARKPVIVPMGPIWMPNRQAENQQLLRTKPLTKPLQKQPPADDSAVKSSPIQPVSTTVVDFRQLALKEKYQTNSSEPSMGIAIHPPLTIEESGGATISKETQPPTQSLNDQFVPNVPSPGASTQFQGEIDQAKVGTSTFTIPPDTMGAVGLDKVFVTLNNNYKVQDKTTGAQLSLVSIDTFWAATGATTPFDPRVQYDPYNNRWLVAATSNAQTANSSVLVGVSDTPDPEGTWTLFRFIVGCAPGAPSCNAQGEWADFPMLGFNKNWVAVGWNQFTINTSVFVSGKMLVIDYPTLRTGTATGTLFSGITASIGGFCLHPATTFSATEETLYMPTHISSAGATYRLHTITGTPGAPTFNVDPASRTRTGGGWTQPGGDILPQQCIPGVGLPTQTCPATIRKIDSGDAFIRSNVVFRDGKIYYGQTIGLPAGGLTRTAAQWTALNTDGTFFDGGRVDDPTATAINGGKWYAYPSVGVNKNNDVLLGFSEFESDDYADAGYTFRLGSDAAGTMRDPVIYKGGEDYYQKTFSGTRNRWGDYSHTVVDPSNDTDLWTIQEYAMLRVGTTGQGTNDSRWGTWWAKVSVGAGPGDLVISEFRLHGPNGVEDEFIEIYNNSGAAVTVAAEDGSAGYSLVADDGTARFTIPNGTTIPARGHYLGCNSDGYSLASHPAGNGTTAICDVTYTANITSAEDLDPGPGVTLAPRQGIALFRTANVANFTLANRLDAVGFVSTSNTLYKEGSGIPDTNFIASQHSFYRSLCPGNTAVFGTALGCFVNSGGSPKDSNANENDYVYVDVEATAAGTDQRIGAPGPENLSSPIQRNSSFGVSLLDVSVAAASPPNRVRDFTSDPGNVSTFGTLDVRRRVVNNTGAAVTRLRFRVVDITTYPPPSGFADLRVRSNTTVVVAGVNDPVTCSPAPAPCTVTVQGTTLEVPPAQAGGGAFNSSISAGTVTLATPLAPGASINVRFLLGIQQTGLFRFYINVEALP